MNRIDERFEFDESELFGDEEHHAKHADVPVEEEPSDDGESTDDEFPTSSLSSRPIPSSQPRAVMMDSRAATEQGPQQGDSGKSSVLNVAIDEDGDDVRRSHRCGMVAQSLPVYSTNVQMGSSLPISIPHLRQWKAEGSGETPEGVAALPIAAMAMADMPATFVPPHQLSSRGDFMFSFTGESPSAVIKKERLRVRNAILKSTGFLEHGHHVPSNLLGLQERARIIGGLSQALHATPEEDVVTSAASRVVVA